MSSIVRLTGLDDFITPSQACIKPLEPADDGAAGPAPGVTIAIEEDGRYIEVADDGTKRQLKKAAITLTDCLACSGCVTSAESILVEMQTYKELEAVLEKRSAMSVDGEGGGDDAGPARVVVSVSPQSVASLAVKHGLTAPAAFRKVAGYLKSIGVDAVYDATFGRSVSLVECHREFVEHFKKGGPFPLLTSACPGWVCYAEKTHGDFVLPHISTVKSPQQVMGTLVKGFGGGAGGGGGGGGGGAATTGAATEQASHDGAASAAAAAAGAASSTGTAAVVGGADGLTPDRVYHVAVMPCYDKKLEASRDDFYSDLFRTRDVDCVITTGELETMMRERGVGEGSWGALPDGAVDTLAPGVDDGAGVASHPGGGAGGYLEHVFLRAARDLFGVDDAEVVLESRRNPDFRECRLVVGGECKLRFAAAYGFKSIQTVMRQMKRGKCPLHYVEIMACPKGCNNGGGQLAAGDGVSDADLFDGVEGAYYANARLVDPDSDPAVGLVFERLGDGAAAALHTQYHKVEKTIVPQLESW